MSKSGVYAGVIWAAAQRFGTMAVSFVTNIVLANLLTPADFGTIGMLAFFIAVANVFVDSGFGSAIIQKKDATPLDFSTVFYSNTTISIICYIALFAGAPLVAAFYHIEALSTLLRVEGLVLLTNSLCVIQTSIMRKEMDFKKLATANLVANVLGATAAITAALLGAGVWSIIVRVLAISLFTAAALWIVNPWRPTLCFSFAAARKLFGFGGFMLLATLLNTIASNLQSLIIGKLWHQGILGYYTQAIQLRTVAADSISSVIGQVLYPDYSNNQLDNTTILNKLNFGIYVISYLTIALMLFLILVAKPLFMVLFGAKWLPAVPYFRILCVGGIFYCIQDVNYYVVAAKGRSRLLFLINLFKIPAFIAALVIAGRLWGMIALLWIIVGYSLISYILFAYFATNLLGATMWRQVVNIAKSTLLCSFPALTTFLTTSFLHKSTDKWILMPVQTAIFVLSFLAISAAVRPKPYKYLMQRIFKKQL